MKILIIILGLYTASSLGNTLGPQKLIGRIARKDNSTYMLKLAPNNNITAHLASPQLNSVIDDLLPGDEVIAHGHMEYLTSSMDSRISYSPIFVIDKITPVSLKRLGVSKQLVQQYPIPAFEKNIPGYAPGAITASAQVTSSLILTASVLLLQSLLSPPPGGDPRGDINAGLTFFAGTLATGIFLFDDFQ